MSYVSRRTAIRAAAVATLSNSGVPPFPTLAKGNVFDSRGSPLQNTDDSKDLPSILVYTDTEIGVPETSMNHASLTWTVELVIEIALAADTVGRETDAQLEEQLDYLEEQVRDALFGVGEDAARFSKLYSKIGSYKSIRMGNSENNNRLAMRGIVIDLTYDSRCKDPTRLYPELKTIGMRFEGEENAPVTDVVT